MSEPIEWKHLRRNDESMSRARCETCSEPLETMRYEGYLTEEELAERVTPHELRDCVRRLSAELRDGRRSIDELWDAI